MANSTEKLCGEANLLGKQKREDAFESNPFPKRHKEEEEEKIRLRFLQAPKKTLHISNFSSETNLSDIIDFFKDVGQVVRVLLPVNMQCVLSLYGFVEFASSNQANKALQEKNGVYLNNCKISLRFPRRIRPTFCIEHKVWYEDYHQQESLSIDEEDETSPCFVEEVLFIANLSSQTQTTIIPSIIRFFENVGEVVNVRFIVNQKGKHVGYGFVEFSSSYGAKRALEEKNGEYFLDRPILLMRVPLITSDPVEVVTVRNKTLFITHFSNKSDISDIINFFKDVGEVVHVRLFVNLKGKYLRHGFVEFASANEAKKALEKKNGECLHDCKIFLKVVNEDVYPRASRRHCIDHMVWYEDEEVEGLDETPDFAEDVAAREKTLFFAGIHLFFESPKSVIRYFGKEVGRIVRVRLIVDGWGEFVGSGYVEFASSDEAKKALQVRKDPKMVLKMAEIDPYPIRTKYMDNLEKLWYEYNLRQESLGSKQSVAKENFVLNFKEIPFLYGNKTTFFDLLEED